MEKRILVVAVHPDDETIGCGGTLLRHIDEGDEVVWLTVTAVNDFSGHDKSIQERRSKELTEVSNLYGFTKSIHLNFATTKLEEYTKSELFSALSKVIQDLKPSVVYLQHPGDVHSEHQAVFNVVFGCTKSFRYPFIKEVYTMETLSETEFAAPFIQNAFIPNHFVDISEYMDKKIDILNLYEGEVGEHPFPRSARNIKSQGVMRGAIAGVEYAEAFMCLKHIR